MYALFYNPDSNFYMWSTIHLITIFIIFVVIISLFYFREFLQPHRHMIRITMGWTLIFSRLSLDFWYITTGQWSLQTSLPFELCSIASILCAIMLFTKNRHLFEIFYFIALAGAIQAILTPDLNFGFPQYRYIQFFIDHLLLIISPLIMIVLYGFTITRKSLIKSFLALNCIAIIIYFVNVLFSSNYMFLRRKPMSGSLLDLLGPYPYYILSLEVVSLIIFIVLYIPFTWKSSN